MANNDLQEPLDPYKLCAAKREIRFHLPLESMERAADLLLTRDGRLELTLAFSYDSQRLPQVTGHLSGDVVLECQRCLGPCEQRLDSHFLWGLVSSDEAAVNLPRTHEPVLLDDGHLDLQDAIEDELLLALPLVAYHTQDSCSLQAELLKVQPAESWQKGPSAPAANEDKNPFSVLADLKQILKTKQ